MTPRMWIPIFLLLAALVPNARAAANGAPVWTNFYNGPGNSNDIATAIAVDKSGNVIVAGYSSGSGSKYDYVTIKYSSGGAPLWTNRYNGPGNDWDQPKALAVDGNGNIFVTGQSWGGGSRWDYATIAYSSGGVPQWTNRYNGLVNDWDQAQALAIDASGNVVITGGSVSSGSLSDYDYVTIKYSNGGVPLWTNRYNGPGNDSDQASAIAIDDSGNIFVTGGSFSSASGLDYATIKYSSAGVALWTNRYSGPGNNTDSATALAVGASGKVFVTGFGIYGDNYVTVAYSSAGAPLWTNIYDGPGNAFDEPNALKVDKSENVFVTGYSWGSYGYPTSSIDYATIKYSGVGVPLWTNRYNGAGNSADEAKAIVIDENGNVFVAGYAATLAYSGAGVPLWTNVFIAANAAVVDGNGNIFVTGSLFDTNGNGNFATIKYSKYAALLTLTQAAADEGQFRFQFNADSNLTYAVEFRDAASATNWVTFTNLPAQPAATNFTFTTAITNPARLYRVRTP